MADNTEYMARIADDRFRVDLLARIATYVATRPAEEHNRILDDIETGIRLFRGAMDTDPQYREFKRQLKIG